MRHLILDHVIIGASWSRFTHCIKYRNITKFPDVEILLKDRVSAMFWANRPKLRISTKFPHQEIWLNYDILRGDNHIHEVVAP